MRQSRLSNAVLSSRAVGAGILASAVYFVLLIVADTFEHVAFLQARAARYSETRWHPSYPSAGVVGYSVLILVEAFILWVALTRVRAPLWRRAFASTGVALLAILTTFATHHNMHSPPAGDDHALWLLWIAAAMLVTTAVAGVARFVQLRRTMRSPGSPD